MLKFASFFIKKFFQRFWKIKPSIPIQIQIITFLILNLGLDEPFGAKKEGGPGGLTEIDSKRSKK